ncbi:hypothetical protein ZWY2020_027879 [Hordeum vulgare]|nr:hypothetical protein ZWY2020_027879 [Hordeum vulgare]
MDSVDDQQQGPEELPPPPRARFRRSRRRSCNAPTLTRRSAELSRDLGQATVKVQQERQDYDFLRAEIGREPHKVKYWFQNRRTQKKMQQGQQDNDFLRARTTGSVARTLPWAMRPTSAEDYYHEQQLRVENARLKEELAGLTYKPLGRPFTQMPQRTPQMSACRTDGGTEVVAYEQPQPTAGIHRLAFVVFRQTARGHLRTRVWRSNFVTRDMAECYNLGARSPPPTPARTDGRAPPAVRGCRPVARPRP